MIGRNTPPDYRLIAVLYRVTAWPRPTHELGTVGKDNVIQVSYRNLAQHFLRAGLAGAGGALTGAPPKKRTPSLHRSRPAHGTCTRIRGTGIRAVQNRSRPRRRMRRKERRMADKPRGYRRRGRSADQHTSAHTQRCCSCLYVYDYEKEYRCVACGRPVCPLCVVFKRASRPLCPNCFVARRAPNPRRSR